MRLFCLRSYFLDFPKGTVHLVAGIQPDPLLTDLFGINIEEHHLHRDLTMESKSSGRSNPGIMFSSPRYSSEGQALFPQKYSAPIARLSVGPAAQLFHDFGGSMWTNFRKTMPSQPKATREKNIDGDMFLRVDCYGKSDYKY